LDLDFAVAFHAQLPTCPPASFIAGERYTEKP
jgi:hypothetical protein